MDGTENQKDPSAVARQDASKGDQGTPKHEPRLIPESEVEARVQKQVSDRLAQAGRDAKALEARETEVQKRAQEIADWQARKDEEERRSIQDNPELLDIFTQKKLVRDAKEKLKADSAAFERDKVAHQVEIESARATQMEIDIFTIAGEYEGGDPVKLKSLCENFGSSTKEQIIKAADTLWTKKTAQVAEKVKRDTGMTQGGGGDNLGDLSPKDRLKEIDRRLREK